MLKKAVLLALTVCLVVFVCACDKKEPALPEIPPDAPAIELAPDAPAIQLSPDAPAIQAVFPAASPADSPAPNGIPDAGEEKKPEKLSYSGDYQRFASANRDVCGWISVPNTHIEYPVLQTDDNDFYLTHTPQKQYSKSGSVFMDYRCDADSGRHIIIYGHNMRNGSMFHDLNSFKNKDFFANTPTITFYDKNGEKRQYDVFASFIVTADMDFARTKFQSDEAFLQYFEGLRANSKHQPKNKVELTAESQIISLITCTYEYDNSRYLVQAVRR